MDLKDRIMEQYCSVEHFCSINNISRTNLYKYINGRRSINAMRSSTLSKICTGLDCFPEDIGYTNNYWWVITKNPRIKEFTK